MDYTHINENELFECKMIEDEAFRLGNKYKDFWSIFNKQIKSQSISYNNYIETLNNVICIFTKKKKNER